MHSLPYANAKAPTAVGGSRGFRSVPDRLVPDRSSRLAHPGVWTPSARRRKASCLMNRS